MEAAFFLSSTSNRKVIPGRIGGLMLHATHSTDAIAAKARGGLEAKFLREVTARAVEAGEELTPAEIEQRASFAKRAYFARLALKSAQVRRERAGRASS